jgi:murein DD-endopeptidase MepM/ murein hydrolase activator NlpD
MNTFSLELPKYRLQFHYRLVKRRKPLVAEPLIPSVKTVKRKYRSGTILGRFIRYISYHKMARRMLSAGLAAAVVIGTFIPSGYTNVQAADLNTPANNSIIQAQNTLITEKSIQFPLDQIKINQSFGLFHPGVDFGAPIGTPLKPVKAGKIVVAEYTKDGYGNTILIDHGKGLTSRYAHLSKIEVVKGQDVTTNTEIGKVGITGHSTGPHLHLEIRQNGFPLNPVALISR